MDALWFGGEAAAPAHQPTRSVASRKLAPLPRVFTHRGRGGFTNVVKGSRSWGVSERRPYVRRSRPTRRTDLIGP